ncbi:hypothetical protein K504DRAFT_457564 [Pleomassaria siparia CBS 279.74]|uniref:Uncharacterized protein n=1 Tax=Pleomassaria siparia CBS 279.74 TaxID=1314801 RepID=A0A6G1KRB2_9PLEO|nr:hypothetical protein K504DRAFT_457564 [Pleomassaria siparia CBS 279.74]
MCMSVLGLNHLAANSFLKLSTQANTRHPPIPPIPVFAAPPPASCFLLLLLLLLLLLGAGCWVLNAAGLSQPALLGRGGGRHSAP